MKKIDIAKITPRFITVLIAKILLRLMNINHKYDIILYQELGEFISYNSKGQS